MEIVEVKQKKCFEGTKRIADESRKGKREVLKEEEKV